MELEIEDRLRESNALVNKVMIEQNVSPCDYNWNLFAKTIENSYGITWKSYPFGPISKNYHAGTIVFKGKKARIYYNSNMKLCRQNFTICHELSHFIFDTKFGKYPDVYSSQILDAYTDEEKINEQIIDASAGVLMLPDITLVNYLEKTISFPKMADQLEMTQTALYVRLCQFLESKVNLTSDYIRRIVNDYRYYGKKDVIHKYLSGWGSTVKKQIILDYENSL